jgi:hypothetical protein
VTVVVVVVAGRPRAVIRYADEGRTIVPLASKPLAGLDLVDEVERAIREKLRGRARTAAAEVAALLSSFPGAYLATLPPDSDPRSVPDRP